MGCLLLLAVNHELYMHRCLQLAALGAGHVAPNPMVGAVLVHNDRILAEGYHQQFGQAHAEVNCLDAVADVDRHLIPTSTLFVSLEPCAHFGKTPPCVNRILAEKIPTVVVGCQDDYREVNGKGMALLREAGVNVIAPVLEKESRWLNRAFFTFHERQRPFVILKWAQSIDAKIAAEGKDRTLISNDYSNILVHRWRSEVDAILVGTNTVLADNPSLTTRLWPGRNPLRLVLDRHLKIPERFHVLDGKTDTWVFTERVIPDRVGVKYVQIDFSKPVLQTILHHLHQQQIQQVLVEGGAGVFQSFIDAALWDEARVITNTQLNIGKGLAAPNLPHAQLFDSTELGSDLIHFYQPASFVSI